jgi:hypothetical protein
MAGAGAGIRLSPLRQRCCADQPSSGPRHEAFPLRAPRPLASRAPSPKSCSPPARIRRRPRCLLGCPDCKVRPPKALRPPKTAAPSTIEITAVAMYPSTTTCPITGTVSSMPPHEPTPQRAPKGPTAAPEHDAIPNVVKARHMLIAVIAFAGNAKICHREPFTAQFFNRAFRACMVGENGDGVAWFVPPNPAKNPIGYFNSGPISSR